ncbi:MAG: sugar ABC transporter permease [Planctomycetota bacterium]|nr:sugar ABC transporter permease [Planctomycetota bacterium]
MNRQRYRDFLLFVGPPLLVYGVFCLYPTVAGIIGAFTEWDGYSQTQRFTGLANFRKMAADDVFWTALQNNLFLVAVPGIMLLALGLYFSSALRDERTPGRRVFQFTYLFPNILAGVVVATLWSFVYSPSFGVVKGTLEALHNALRFVRLDFVANALSLKELSRQAWLEPQYFMRALVPMLVWAGTGFFVVLFLAGMQNIPRDLYEAARLDGANEWQVFRHVTWPGLSPIMLAAVTFVIIGGMKTFDCIWVMTQQHVPDRNQVLATYVYQQAFSEARMGYGTAVALVLLFVTLGFVLVAHRMMRR